MMSLDVSRGFEDLLGEGAIEPHFQPIVMLADGRVVAMEALVRWRAAGGSVVNAEAVWAVADRLGARAALTQAMAGWAIETFSRAEWSTGLELSVNASCADLAQSGFVDAVFEVLARSTALAPRLWVEVTEDAPLTDPEAVRASLARLRAFGVRIALDDFGTAHANLAWLVALPVDSVKIDRRFVQKAAESSPERAIVRRIIDLADDLGVGVVAEGVETEAQRIALMSLGCRRGQGRLFGMPMSASAILR